MLSVAALLTAVALMAVSGVLIAGALVGATLAAPALLRVLGPLRVVLRYFERVTTHDAMFRALADLRVFFFPWPGAPAPPAASASGAPATCWRGW